MTVMEWLQSMNESYELLNLNGQDRNVERLGTFIAWLVANDLFDAQIEAAAGSAIARLRMQDLTGPEFFTTVMYGEFKPDQLKHEGQAFVESYFVSGQQRRL